MRAAAYGGYSTRLIRHHRLHTENTLNRSILADKDLAMLEVECGRAGSINKTGDPKCHAVPPRGDSLKGAGRRVTGSAEWFPQKQCD